MSYRMLIKVKSLTCKTKTNVKIKQKNKTTYVIILSIFLVSREVKKERFFNNIYSHLEQRSE